MNSKPAIQPGSTRLALKYNAPADSAPRAVESEQAAANKAVNKTTKKDSLMPSASECTAPSLASSLY